MARFITRNDSRQQFCFVPLGSGMANTLLTGFDTGNVEKGSVVLVMNGRIFLKSDAVFRILRRLDGFWPLMYIFIIVPKFVRDPVYDIIAKYRYRWFGPCIDCPDYRPCAGAKR